MRTIIGLSWAQALDATVAGSGASIFTMDSRRQRLQNSGKSRAVVVGLTLTYFGFPHNGQIPHPFFMSSLTAPFAFCKTFSPPFSVCLSLYTTLQVLFARVFNLSRARKIPQRNPSAAWRHGIRENRLAQSRTDDRTFPNRCHREWKANDPALKSRLHFQAARSDCFLISTSRVPVV